jgi:phage shock protein PspC (stress-responsive transcriptional regulator)
MKKTLTVNISGQVFHIDEDAYSILNDYLQSIRQHFAKTKGGDEIFTDIEARIAEMLRERLIDNKQVITIEDISEVIKTIGEPSEFGGDEFEEQSHSGSQTNSGKYTKRLYRDPEDAMLGGVCSGLAAYFHTDRVWFRLGFTVAAIAGFGAPILIYILLWIVVPPATSATDRLEMKGEKVNLSNIGTSVREEIEKVKEKINDFANEAKNTYKKKSDIHRSNVRNLSQVLIIILEIFVKVILVLTGIILFIIGISLVLAFITLIFGFSHQLFVFDSEIIFIPMQEILNLITGQADDNVFIKMGLILLLGIPILMILWGGIKLIFGITRTRYVGVLFFNLWLIGLIICMYFGIKLGKSFRYPGNYQESQKIELRSDTLIDLRIAANEKTTKLHNTAEYVEIEDLKMYISSDNRDVFYGLPELRIEKAADDKISLETIKMAKGKSTSDADDRAKRTIYHFENKNNALIFDPFFQLPEKELWRVQQVNIILEVPVGTYIRIDEDMDRVIDKDNEIGYDLAGKTWKMTESGLVEAVYPPQ